jgi:hypothetical protein
MDIDKFEIVIIIFVIAIGIHFICKKQKKITEYDKIENMDNNIISNGLDKTDIQWYKVNNRLVTNDGDVSNGNIIFDDNYDGVIKQNNNINLDKRERPINKKKYKNNNRFDVKEYIRNNVLNGKSQCYCVSDNSKSEFTRTEVDDYREQQLKFQGEMIYGTSAPAIDPVDKMNIIKMDGGFKGNGQTIADVYDSIVRTK